MNGKWTNRSQIEEWYAKEKNFDRRNSDFYTCYLADLHCELLFGCVYMIEERLHLEADETLMRILDKYTTNVMEDIDTLFMFLEVAIKHAE